MRTSLGISAGTEVVCSALVSTRSNGTQIFDYRVVSADAARSDLGDLVASSIELMTTQLPATSAPHQITPPVGRRFAGMHRDVESATLPPPTSVAVAYRTEEQAQLIRSATGRRHELELIPESTAALTYLRHTGLLARYDTVAIVDFGASGLTVTIADQADGAPLRADRTTSVSGKAIDELIYQHLVALHFARRSARPNRGMLTNRGRAAKEHLSVATSVTVDHVAGRPVKLTRVDFEELVADLLHSMTLFVTATFARAPQQPQAVAVIGGGANIPTVVDTLTTALDVPVLTVPDPEAVTAKGAALIADTAQASAGPAGAHLGEAPTGAFAKVFGTLAGAIVVVGLIIGYGVKTFAPTSENDVSPAGTTNSTSGLPTPTSPPTSAVPKSDHPAPQYTAQPSSGGIRQTTTTQAHPDGSSIPSSTPTVTPTQLTLRPDPDLPLIPFPELLAPMLGNPHTPGQPPPEAPPDPTVPSAEPPPDTGSTPHHVPPQSGTPYLPPADSGSASSPRQLIAPNRFGTRPPPEHPGDSGLDATSETDPRAAGRTPDRFPQLSGRG
ncbi:Hsp70 family protein [Nocardia sp. CNY236]|uniref:Hsp70 family protein n=1 Tax=Nocardia sp. CNY236 TaxID=1169152 RepID=UPI00041F4EA5|nr:Hsp70 family protein [Nocardia sp. CNY236]